MADLVDDRKAVNEPSAYDRALGRVAETLDLSPGELERRLDRVSEALRPTEECPTLDDLEGDEWWRSPAWARHVRSCGFCRQLLAVMEPSEREVQSWVGRFIEEVRDRGERVAAGPLLRPSGHWGAIPAAKAAPAGSWGFRWTVPAIAAAVALSLATVAWIFLRSFSGGPGMGNLQAERIPITTDSTEARTLFLRAELALQAGERATATDLLERAVAADGDFAFAHLNLALASESEFERTRGIDRAASALEGKSNGEKLLINLNEALVSGDATRASELSEQLVNENPRSPEAWIAAAFVRSTNDDPEGARGAFERAVSLDPVVAHAYVELFAGATDSALAGITEPDFAGAAAADVDVEWADEESAEQPPL
jgi:hypothetical protein